MELNSELKKKRVWLEIKDLLTGAAFPLMLQLILSASVILFADYSGEAALQIFALVFGEALLVAAYIVFGRQNGIAAYRRTVQNEKKRQLNPDDIDGCLNVGNYAVWKGVVIGAITVVPFALIEFIECLVPNTVCEFILKYAFGWAAYPFILVEQIPSVGDISEWLNFVWILLPVAVHTAAYIWGGTREAKRQQKIAEAQEVTMRRR